MSRPTANPLSRFFFSRLTSGSGPAAPSAQMCSAGLVGVLLLACGWLLLRGSGLRWDWEAVGAYWQLFLSGWWNTVGVSLAALLLSTLLGAGLAIAQRSDFLPLRYLAKCWVELIRGTPLLVQIYVLFYIVADAVQLENRAVAGVLILSVFSGAYLAEVFRAGIESVGRSQLESAQAIGLTRAQTYRHVILPQALRSVLPSLAGQFVSLIKDSSLLSVIGLNEFTQSARNVASYTYSNFESYLLLAAGYLLLTLPISVWTRRMEQRFRYET
jgi:polar amino acid transport system permease protein